MKKQNRAIPKKQSKGMKKASETLSKEIKDTFNAVLKNIFKAWSFIAKQNVTGINNLYGETEMEYASINKNYGEDVARKFKLLSDCAKIPFHIVEGLSFNLLNKPERVSNEYEKADKRYNAVLENFQKIESTMDKEILPAFKFLLEFSHLVIFFLKEDSYKVLRYKKGKYVGQVERFRDLARHFRKVVSHLARFDNEDEEFNDLINDIKIFVMRVSDKCDENADAIESDNREIAFLPPIGNKVFIVHGHGTEILQELKGILMDLYEIKPVVLSEMPDGGGTVIEKFERYARFSSFVFVIITPDDIVENKGEIYLQGRPNALLELGWFYGRFGRGKVRLLKHQKAKLPSDLDGILTLNFNEKLAEISVDIKKDLENNGIINKGVSL